MRSRIFLPISNQFFTVFNAFSIDKANDLGYNGTIVLHFCRVHLAVGNTMNAVT